MSVIEMYYRLVVSKVLMECFGKIKIETPSNKIGDVCPQIHLFQALTRLAELPLLVSTPSKSMILRPLLRPFPLRSVDILFDFNP